MTYADLHLLASQFVNEDEHSRDLRSPQALEYRLFLSKFLVRVKQREDEARRVAMRNHTSYCRLNPEHEGHCSIREHKVLQFDLTKEVGGASPTNNRR